MSALLDSLSQPWPWYVAGPLLGILVALLLLLTGKGFGLSYSFQHVCAAASPAAPSTSTTTGSGSASGTWSSSGDGREPRAGRDLQATHEALAGLGIRDFEGLVPDDLIGWGALATLPGFVAIVIGGFLVGFGARWAGGSWRASTPSAVTSRRRCTCWRDR